MTALVRAELLRIRSRRLSWVALGLVLLIVALTQIAVLSSVRPLSAAEEADARTQYQQAAQDYEANYERDLEQCVADGNPRDVCSYPAPQLEDYAGRPVGDFAEVSNLSITVAVLMTALALLMISASLVGADFSTGALANWLSFVPERTKVFLAKLLAAVVAGVVAMAVVAAVALGLTVLMTVIAGADVVGLGDAAAKAARGILVGVVAVVIGFGIAMLTRHTIAAVGTVLAYLFFTFVYNILVFIVPAVQGLQAFLPENHALSLLDNGTTYTTFDNQRSADGTFEQIPVEHTISMAQSGLYWVVVLGALVGLTLLVFRRRDVS